MAANRGWLTVDVHSAHASQAIIEAITGGTEKTVGKSVEPGALGISVGSLSSTTSTTFSEASLGHLLVEKCGSLALSKGLLITVDEIQKVPESDAENLCAATQLVMRKGLPIMLVLAGLPGAKERVASYPGCTFMQRTYDMKIGCMGIDETITAFESVFRKMPEFDVSGDAIWEAGWFSQGYPYLMQLIGDHAVERAKTRMVAGSAKIDAEHIRAAEPMALEAYRENVLDPILAKQPDTLSSYLRIMCEVEEDDGRISTGAVARMLGKEQNEVSSYRARLIERRLIEPDGQGYARFLLPHIGDYYSDAAWEIENKDPDQQWNRYRPER